MIIRSMVLVLLIGISLCNRNILYSASESCGLENNDYSYHDDHTMLQLTIDTIPVNPEGSDVNSIVLNIDTSYTGQSLGATEFVNQKAILQSARRFSDELIKRTLPLPYIIVNWHLLFQRYIFDLK